MIEAVAWLLLAWHKEGGFVKVGPFESEYDCNEARRQLIVVKDTLWYVERYEIKAVCIEVPAAQNEDA